jgi:hypothetical protein
MKGDSNTVFRRKGQNRADLGFIRYIDNQSGSGMKHAGIRRVGSNTNRVGINTTFRQYGFQSNSKRFNSIHDIIHSWVAVRNFHYLSEVTHAMLQKAKKEENCPRDPRANSS